MVILALATLDETCSLLSDSFLIDRLNTSHQVLIHAANQIKGF